MSRTALWTGMALLWAGAAAASDGVIEINQATAVAGAINGSLAADPAGFPVAITQPGSYRLTSDLVMPEVGAAPQNTSAISVQADGVSVDLGGFSIRGNNSCNLSTCTALGTGSGIDSTRERTRVSNGSVVGMGSDGVEVGLLGAVSGVIAEHNGGVGIAIFNASRVENSQARSNKLGGIRGTDTTTIQSNVVDVNGGPGIQVAGNSSVIENTSNANLGNGIRVTGTTGGALIRGNIVNFNTGAGIFSNAYSTVLGNQIHSNASGYQGALSGFADNVIADNPPGCNIGGTPCNEGQFQQIGCNLLESGGTGIGFPITCCPDPATGNQFRCF